MRQASGRECRGACVDGFPPGSCAGSSRVREGRPLAAVSAFLDAPCSGRARARRLLGTGVEDLGRGNPRCGLSPAGRAALHLALSRRRSADRAWPVRPGALFLAPSLGPVLCRDRSGRCRGGCVISTECFDATREKTRAIHAPGSSGKFSVVRNEPSLFQCHDFPGPLCCARFGGVAGRGGCSIGLPKAP